MVDTELLALCISTKEQISELEEQLDELKKKNDDTTAKIIEEMMEDGIQSMKYGGFSFSPGIKILASVPAGGEGIDWLKDNGMADIVTETVHAQRMASYVREYMAEQNILTVDELPEDFRSMFRVYGKPTLSMRSAR
jgi:ferritin